MLGSSKTNSDQPRSFCFGLDHLTQIRRDQLNFYNELRNKYGDVVRLKIGYYRFWLLFHPDQVEALLTRHWALFIRSLRLTEVLTQWNGDSFLLSEGEEWRERHRKVMPSFQSRRLPNYGRISVKHADQLGVKLARMANAENNVIFDVDAVVSRLTHDIGLATLFGAEPTDNGDKIEEALQILSDVAFQEVISPFTLPDWIPVVSKRRKLWAIGVMNKLVTGPVENGLAQRTQDQSDLLPALIEQHNGHLSSIRDDAMGLLIAGHETSSPLH